MIVDEEDFLEHYGVKGMRWGRRKSSSNTGRDRKKTHKGAMIAVGLLAVGGTLAVRKISSDREAVKAGQAITRQLLSSSFSAKLANGLTFTDPQQLAEYTNAMKGLR